MKPPVLAALLACATAGSALAAPLKPANLPNGDPYPSTYHAVPSAPVLLRAATVLTGTGERLDETDVLLQNGRVAAIGRNLQAPAESTISLRARMVCETPLRRKTTARARPSCTTTRSTRASVSTARLGRFSAGRRKPRAALQRRPVF